MRMRRLGVAITLTAKELVRRRVVVLMLLVVPTVFYGVILAITTTKPIDFQLAAIEEEDYVRVAQRDEALVFIGLAAVGVLTAFLGLNLAQRDFEACRRLVVCGYRPWELALSRLAVLVGVVFGVSVLAVAVLPLFFSVGHIVMVAAGFALCGWVYGCYGLAVGAFLRQELEGVLFVALLANLDIGWLQNPIYYAHAQNQAVIRSLPGFLPWPRPSASTTSRLSSHR